jgi:hypothetical protein
VSEQALDRLDRQRPVVPAPPTARSAEHRSCLFATAAVSPVMAAPVST